MELGLVVKCHSCLSHDNWLLIKCPGFVASVAGCPVTLWLLVFDFIGSLVLANITCDVSYDTGSLAFVSSGSLLLYFDQLSLSLCQSF